MDDEIVERRTADAVILTEIKNLREMIDLRFVNNQREHTTIITQTTKTNGNLAEAFIKIDDLQKIEDEKIDEIKTFQNRVIGGLVVLNILLVPVVIVLLIKIFSK